MLYSFFSLFCLLLLKDVKLGQVLLARHQKQGAYYAVKVLQKQMIVKRKEVSTCLRICLPVYLSTHSILCLCHVSRSTWWLRGVFYRRHCNILSWLDCTSLSRRPVLCSSCWTTLTEGRCVHGGSDSWNSSCHRRWRCLTGLLFVLSFSTTFRERGRFLSTDLLSTLQRWPWRWATSTL